MGAMCTPCGGRANLDKNFKDFFSNLKIRHKSHKEFAGKLKPKIASINKEIRAWEEIIDNYLGFNSEDNQPFEYYKIFFSDAYKERESTHLLIISILFLFEENKLGCKQQFVDLLKGCLLQKNSFEEKLKVQYYDKFELEKIIYSYIYLISKFSIKYVALCYSYKQDTIDEIEASYHPDVIKSLVNQMLLNETSNQVNLDVFFDSHYRDLINDSLMREKLYQIYLQKPVKS